MIDKNLPPEYQYETDYRKIPRRYLNLRISKGRGMVKWHPFKTIPDQYRLISEYEENQNKVHKPLLTDEQVLHLNQQIQFAIYNNFYVSVDYWKDGYMRNIKGFIKNIDEIKE